MASINALSKQPEDHLRFTIAPTVRFARDAEGLVLLDVLKGCYLTFNPLGGLVWSRIEVGESTCEIIRSVSQVFPDEDQEVIAQDVRSLLFQLLREGMITIGQSEGCPAPLKAMPTSAREADAGTGPAGFFATASAFMVLIYIDFLMRFDRFRRVYDIVRDATTRPRYVNAKTVERICRATDRASRAYLKRAWCLQRSAACVCLLRHLGAPAELVFGVRTFPFAAHAWVELEGQVLNDNLEYVGSFLVLDRI